MSEPDLVLAGFGMRDTLQLTVETQRLLSRYGKVHALGIGPNLRRLLKSQRVKVVDLGHLLAPDKPFTEAYLDLAQAVLDATTRERPVVFLTQSNPLFMNAVSRLLTIEGRRVGLDVLVLPGVSAVDVVINEIGLDVASFGLQVFDAAGLVRFRLPVSPAMPALLLNAAGCGVGAVPGDDSAADLTGLVSYLTCSYPRDHPVTIVEPNLAGPGMRLARVPIEALPGTALTPATCLFLDLVAGR